jgi:hypothetical protein
MEEIGRYEHFSKAELIQMILDHQQIIGELSQSIVELKKEIEELKYLTRKNSTNSSIPISTAKKL